MEAVQHDEDTNDQLLLICGPPATGKSTSLRNLRGDDEVMYLGTESGKRLPFPNKFEKIKITDPAQVTEGFDFLIENPGQYKAVVVDSITFMMDMYESQLVIPHAGSKKGQAAWGDFQQFYKAHMTQVAKLDIPVIHTAHVAEVLDEKEGVLRTQVRMKGALKGQIESYYSNIVYTDLLPIKALEKTDMSMLKVTDREKKIGFKHVYQVQKTKETIHSGIRSPFMMYPDDVVYIEPDAQALIDHLGRYYRGEL